MQSTRSKPRPLGTVRQSLTGLDKIPHLPKLSNSSDTFEKGYRGLQGNAMSVPPAYVKEAQSSNTPQDHLDDRRKNSSKSNQSELRNNISPDLALKKELRDTVAREKELKNQVADLLKIIEELKSEIIDKDDRIAKLQNDIILQESDFESQLSVQLSHHEETKAALEKSNNLVKQLRNEIKTLKIENIMVIDKLKVEFNEKLNLTIKEKDAEIKIRDDKLNKLKQHMADALQGNSWERQQQLEELTKELAKIQDEADMLRSKIKSLSKAKQASCNHCEESTNKLKKALHAMKEKDQTINDYKSLAVTFESQLSQQDRLLKIWAEEKGHKVNLPK